MKNANLKPRKRAYMWSASATFTASASGLILLPFLSRYLEKDILSLWFIFLTLASLVQLLDFGFQPTFIRAISLSMSGAQAIPKVGLLYSEEDNAMPNLKLFAEISEAAKSIYRKISRGALIIMWVPMTIYIYILTSSISGQYICIISWLVFSLSAVFSFYYGYVTAIMEGAALQDISLRYLTLSRLLTLSLAIISLLSGYGIIGLSLSYASGVVFQRFLLVRSFHKKFSHIYEARDVCLNRLRDVVGNLWHNSKRLGITQVGAFLIQKASLLVAASSLGLGLSASYGLSLTIFMAIAGLSQSIVTLNIPLYTQLRQAKDYALLKKSYYKILAISLLACLAGFSLIIFYGSNLLQVFGSKASLLPQYQLVFLAVVLILEVNHSIAASFITTGNTVPFVKPALYSGISIVALSVVLTPVYGVMGLIFSQGIVQLMYNNWHWPMQAHRSLSH